MVPFCPQVTRFQRDHLRLLLRASPPETRAENNIPIYKFPETSIGITSYISSKDENRNIPIQQIPFDLTRLLLNFLSDSNEKNQKD